MVGKRNNETQFQEALKVDKLAKLFFKIMIQFNFSKICQGWFNITNVFCLLVFKSTIKKEHFYTKRNTRVGSC